jgi:hypothetical protein
MRKASLLIGGCLMLGVALNVWAYQTTHPEIMQSVLSTRNAITASIEGGDAEATASGAMELQGLFESLVPIYERMNLAPMSVTIANKAAANAGMTAEAAKSGNMEAAAASHGTIGKACGGCHGQFREKVDGAFRIKTGG